MQFKLSLNAAVLSLASLAAAQTLTVTGITPAGTTKIIADLSSYYASLTAQPAYTSIAGVIATAVPTSVQNQLTGDPAGFASALATATALPTWYTALPSDVKNYFSSVGAAQISIINKDANGAAPGSGVVVKAAGAVLAAGAVAIALM